MEWRRWLRIKGGANEVKAFTDRLYYASEAGVMRDLQFYLNETTMDDESRKRIQFFGLRWSCQTTNESVAKYLLSTGADPNGLDYKNGEALLHVESNRDSCEILRLLLEAGADVDARDNHGQTLLYRRSSNHDTAIVRLLLDAGANVNAVTRNKETPLLHASYMGCSEIVRLLLEAGADVNATDKDDKTPLHYASFRGYSGIATQLIEAHADVNASSKDGETPLLRASYMGHSEIVSLLLEAGANRNAAYKNGKTPLHSASFEGHADIVRLLLEAHAKVDSRNSEGETPLHRAKTSIVARYLLAAGAVPSTVDKYGRYPSHMASALLRHGAASVIFSSSKQLNTPGGDGYFPIHLVLFRVWQLGCSEYVLKMLQVLTENGSHWDSTCDKIVNESTSWPRGMGKQRTNKRWQTHEGPAIRVCVERWIQEQIQGLPLTEVPLEVVRNGQNFTETFLREMATSREVMCRSKICVVGPTFWGKTSLVKSLTSKKPSLVHPDNRTIGIDHFDLIIEEPLHGLKAIKKHVVTF